MKKINACEYVENFEEILKIREVFRKMGKFWRSYDGAVVNIKKILKKMRRIKLLKIFWKTFWNNFSKMFMEFSINFMNTSSQVMNFEICVPVKKNCGEFIIGMPKIGNSWNWFLPIFQPEKSI